MFCGMGVCQECVMTIDGTPARACMTFVRDGMTVRAASRRGAARRAARHHARAGRRWRPSCSCSAAGRPASPPPPPPPRRASEVVLVDERAKLGGQFYKQPSEGARLDESALDRQYRDGRQPDRPCRAGGRRPARRRPGLGRRRARPSCSPSATARPTPSARGGSCWPRGRTSAACRCRDGRFPGS